MNNNKVVPFVIGGIVILLAVVVVFCQKSTRESAYMPPTRTAGKEISMTETPVTYTMTEVAGHKTQTDCWAAINGGVYNLTTWIGSHPGGKEAIISLCGKDGSAAFNAQHGGQGKPEQALVSFKVGNLKSSL